MSTDTDVRRLNLWIKGLSTEALLAYSSDKLAEEFKKISNNTIKKIDNEIDKKPTILLPRTYRNESRMPPNEGFYTPPRSSTSSEGESTGYR